MSFIDDFSHWSKFDKKSQRANPIEMKFPMVNHKIRKKIYYLVIHLLYH